MSAAAVGRAAVQALAALTLLGAGAGELRAQSPEWSATLMAPAFPSPYVSEWERNPQSLVLHVTYTGQAPRDYRIVGSLRGLGRGELVRAESPLLSVAGGPTTEMLNTADLFDWQILPARRGDVENLLRAGVMPEGDYEICVRLLSPSGLQLDEACADVTIANPERPELIFPMSGDPITVAQPTFQWTPVTVPPALGVTYRLRIVERLPGQAPQTAMAANRPHFEEEVSGAPMLLYPVDALPLEEGKEYVWRIEALDGMGQPLAAGGLSSELWTFTYNGLGDAIVGIDLEDGFPDEMTLIPGMARLVGLAQAQAEPGYFGVTLNGRATLELDAPYIGSVPVRLQDLEVEAVAGELQVRAGRLVGQLPAGLVPEQVLGPYVKLDRLEYTPAEGLRVGGVVALPGGRDVRLAGDAHLTGIGIYGTLEARAGSGEPLLRLGGEPVALRIDEARIQLPEGGLDVVGGVELFGVAAQCGDLRARIDETGEWQGGVACAGELAVPLGAGVERARIEVGSAVGELGFSLAEGTLSHSLELRAALELDAGSAGACGANFGLNVQDGQVSLHDMVPHCSGARSTLGWLELGLSNLRIGHLTWARQTGFDFNLLVDLNPSLPALPELRLPALHDVAIDTDGLSVPALDEAVGPLDLRAGGFGVRVTRVRTPGFTLSWADWQARRAGAASFGLVAELSMPRLSGAGPACLTSRAPATSATLADGRFTLELDERSYLPGECRFALGGGIELDIEQVSGGVELALLPRPALERLPELAGSLSVPEVFRCTAANAGPGGPGANAGGNAGGANTGDRLALAGGVRIGPDGELSGRVEGVLPPCPIAFAGVEVMMTSAALEFGGDAEQRSMVLSGGGQASFAVGGQAVDGSGEIAVDLVAGRLVDGALDFAGPLDFALPREAPVLSFTLASARLDTLGLHVDGRNELVLPGGERIGTTFDNVVFDPTALAITDGRILFDAPFALDIGVTDDGALSWGAVEADAAFGLETGARVGLPDEVWIDADGLGASGGGAARLVYAGHDMGGLSAEFTEDFAVRLEPIGVAAGALSMRHDGVLLATVDAQGFHPNFAYLGAALLPERLGLPNEAIAYLELRDADGELRVMTENAGQGVRVYTLPDQRVPLVVPALQMDAPAAPELEVGFDLTLDPLGGVVAGSLEAAVPPGQASLFDLRREDVPFVVDSLVYADEDGQGHTLMLAGRVALPGELADGAGTVRVELSAAGRLKGSFALDAEWAVELTPDSYAAPLGAAPSGDVGLRYAFEGLEGAFDIDLATRAGLWNVDLSGALELALGVGEPYRAAATVRAADDGLSLIALEAGLPDVFSYFDLGGVRLGVGNVSVPRLEFDDVDGWDFELGFDLALDFPELGGLTLPAVPDVRLGTGGLTIPDILIPELSLPAFELGGFALRPLAFRMDSLHLDPLGGNVPASDAWGFSFDLELGFGELPEGMPAALSSLKLTVLDAGFSGGRLTGTIEPRELTNPIPLALGDAGMALNLMEFGGSLLDVDGAQRITLSASATWTPPEYLRCDAAPAGPVTLPAASLTLDGAAGVSGSITDFVPGCPVQIGPLALRATESELIFAAGSEGQAVELDLEGQLRLPGLAEGDTMVATGALAVDLLAPRIVRGGIDVNQPFRWGLPIEHPFLSFAVTQARLDADGFVFSGTGSVRLEDDVALGVQFDQLTFALPNLAITDGSATFQGGFALDAGLEGGLSWAARPADAPRPAGAGVRLVVPDQATIDAAGLAISGTGAGEIAFNDSVFTALAVDFTDGFRLAFEPVGVEDGRANFKLNDTEIAYLDASGFWPGDIFGMLPIPARLGLPTEAVAYLRLRDPDSDELLIETTQEGEGLRLGTVQGGAVSLVVPALAADGQAAPEVMASFDVVVDPVNFAFVSGSVNVAASEEAEALFALDSLGVPLEVRRLAFDDADGQGYALRLDARVRLPDALDGAIVDFEDIVVSADGLSGEVLLGSYRQDHAPEDGPVASFGTSALELRVMGAKAAFGPSPSVELDGALLTEFFADAEGAPAPLGFTAGVAAAGVSFAVDLDALEGGRLPLGAASFEPRSLSERDPIEVEVGAEIFRVRLGGVLRVPSLGDDFGLTIDGLEVGTDGVTLPTLALSVPEEWQSFELFGASFTLKDSADLPGIALTYEEAVLALTLAGEIEFLDNVSSFRGLRIASDGTFALEEASLISEPITLVPGALELAALRIADTQLHVDLGVELPAPFDSAGAQQVTVSIAPDGTVSGGGKILLLDETPGLGGERTQFGGELATLHLRYLAVELNLGADDLGGVDVVGDVYLAGEEGNRIKLGDRQGNTVLPGFRLGFDGSVAWGNVALAREFDFDFDVMRLTLSEVTAEQDEDGRNAIGFGGSLSINVAAVSGGLSFTDFRINDRLQVDFEPSGVQGGHLSIAEVVALEFSGFEYSAEPTTIAVPAGGLPSSNSSEVTAATDSVDVASYLRFGGSIEVVGMAGGVDEFLLYRTADQGLTNLLVRRANLSINGVLDMSADFRYAQTPGGFEMLVGAEAQLLELYEAIVVGMIEHGTETRAGLFVALGVEIPLVPPALVLSQVGGGFFYNARQEHLDLVRQYAQVPGLDGGAFNGETGRFTGMLYANAVIVAQQIAQARVLLTVSEVGAQLDGRMALLSTSGDLNSATVRGDLNLAVGFQQKYAEGNFKLIVDFDPIIRTQPGNPIEVGFFVYGSDAWGIYGGGSLEYLRLVSGEGDFFVGPPGFMVSANLQAGFDFWIIAVNGEMDGTVWYQVDPREWGGYMTVGVGVDLLGGAVSAEAQLRGALLAGGSSPYIYAGALARGKALFLEGEAHIWAKFQNGGVTGGFGKDPAMDEIIARANQVRAGMENAAQAMQDAIAEGPPAPETLTMSENELAEAYQRLQSWGQQAVQTGMLFAYSFETGIYTGGSQFSPVSNEMNYLNWYRDLMAQVGAPTVSGNLPLEAYADSVAARVQAIVDRQEAVNDRVATIQADIAELQHAADRPWPESPVRSMAFGPPQARVETDADGNEIKVLEDGPGFDIDQAAAEQARLDLEEREAEAEALAQQVRDQIQELEAGLANLRDVLTSTDENSVLVFSRLHADAIELAEEQYARHGDYVLRKQDWYQNRLSQLQGQWPVIRSVIQNKTSMLRNTSHPGYSAGRVDDLAYNRALGLALLTDDPSILDEYQSSRSGLSPTHSWFDQQADTLGMMLWYHLARAGMQAADSAATTEYRWVRQQMQSRLVRMYAQHMALSRSYNRLYTRQAELVGTLYDLYDRYAVWLDNLEGYEDERAQVLARMAELSQDLQVPTVTNAYVVSSPGAYMAREYMVWNGSHPTGTYEYLFYVDQPERQILQLVEALVGLFTGNAPDELGGLTTNGPRTNRWRYVLTPERGTASINRNAQFAVRGGAGYYGLRQASYQTVFKDGGGWAPPSVSTTVVDDTPPTRPTVSFVGHEGTGTYWVASNERLELEWSSTDSESGIAEYQYAVGTNSDTTAVRGWTSAGGRTQIAVHGLPLLVGTHQRVYVRARNGQGLWSSVGRSPVLRYDPTPPVFAQNATLATTQSYEEAVGALSGGYKAAGTQDVPTVDGEGVQLGTVDFAEAGGMQMDEALLFEALNLAALPACTVEDPLAEYAPSTESSGYGWSAWSGFFGGGSSSWGGGSIPLPVTPTATFFRPTASDPVSGVERYYWRVTTGEPAVFDGPEGWTAHPRASQEIEITGAPLDYEQEFYLTVVAANRAGLVSEPVVTSFRIPDPTPPTPPSFCVGQWTAASSSNGALDRALSVAFQTPARDPETGVAEYDYRVRTADGTVVRDWGAEAWRTSVPTDDAVRVAVPGLADGEAYYVDIVAQNGQGMETLATSGPFIVDFSPPAAPVVEEFDVDELHAGSGVHTLSARIGLPNDPHSGTTAWAWEVTVAMDPDGLLDAQPEQPTRWGGFGGFFEQSSPATTDGPILTGHAPYSGPTAIGRLAETDQLVPGVVYRLRVLSANGAGLTSRATTVLFTTEGMVDAEAQKVLRESGKW